MNHFITKAEKIMNKEAHNQTTRSLVNRCCGPYLWAVALLLLVSLAGCTAIQDGLKGAEPKAPEPDPLTRAKTLFNEGNYDAALKENQKLLAERKAAPDMALFNMGLIHAYSSNPKKDYPTALGYFKTLVTQYPKSPMFEQSTAWVQVLEEHQKLADERQKLLEEKRLLTREREAMGQEREKLKQTVEKSRQLDIEIDKRRRQMYSK
jgi:outer membrane protein assembly factor BamD (BamD/ComL family)